MFSQLFGKHLEEQGIISATELQDILKKVSSERVKLGTIAVAEGLMTEQQSEEVNHLQVQFDKRFGDIAVEKGYLTEAQVEDLLSKQGSSYMKFLQVLLESKRIAPSKVDENMVQFQKKYGFSNDEFNALKNDDIDAIIPFFAYSSKPFVTDMVSLTLRNLVRFVTDDFYIGTIKPVESFDYKILVGQMIKGSHNIVLAFVQDNDEDGIRDLAEGFSDHSHNAGNNEIYDAIGEFANICNGLFVTELSSEEVDMEPPFTYLSQTAKGKGYLVPLFIHGREMKIFIAVDNEVVLGDTPYSYVIEKKAGTEASEDSKGTVVIVDDSALIRKMLRGLLEADGYTVVGEAVNGEEGVAEYKKNKPDIITLDITMPVMDGLEALKQIMEYDKDAKVIMITAAGQQQKVITALKLGAAKFMMKPFNKDEVIGAFEELRG